jgi:AmmeMemoRadiSam system protein B
MPRGKKLIIFTIILSAAAVFITAGALIFAGRHSQPAIKSGEQAPRQEMVDVFPYDPRIFNAAVAKDYPSLMATSSQVIAGLVPHHDLADDLTAQFFSSLAKRQAVKNFIIIGPLHSDQAVAPMVSGRFVWDAGFAQVHNNYQILDELARQGLIAYDERATRDEHSLYNVVPFIAHYFPGAKIVPIALTSRNNTDQCFALAAALQKYLAGGDTVLVASVDFSHYLPASATPAKNEAMIKLMADRDYYAISHLQSDYLDSPASVNVLLKSAELAGAPMKIIASSNSGEIIGGPVQSSTSYITAYFSAASSGSADAGSLPAAANRQLTMLFFGDIMLDRHVGDKIKAAGGLAPIFAGLADSGILGSADLQSANLEGAVTDGGAHYPPANPIDFAFAPASVAQLKQFGFDYFNIANNHLADQGKNGIMETEKNLSALGFDFAGCADHQTGDCTAKVIDRNGYKIGLTGASMVYGSLDEKSLLAKVKFLASSTDLVIAQMHWGTEYQHEANRNQISLAHQLIDAGADIVIGHHPHVVEGMEVYKDKPIFYSLGNFIFDQYFSTDTQEELGVKISAAGKNFQIDLLPIKSESTHLRLMDQTEKEKFLAGFSQWSSVGTGYEDEIRSGTIRIDPAGDK